MFVYHLTKNVFYDEMISIIRSIYQVSSNSETKNFSAQKTPKGLAFKIFWVHQKKKNLFNKCCRACQQESAYKIIQGSGF
jgi:hypothetical protein